MLFLILVVLLFSLQFFARILISLIEVFRLLVKLLLPFLILPNRDGFLLVVLLACAIIHFVVLALQAQVLHVQVVLHSFSKELNAPLLRL